MVADEDLAAGCIAIASPDAEAIGVDISSSRHAAILRTVKQMKHIFMVALVAAPATSAGAGAVGPDGFDEVSTAVESTREARSNSYPEWLADVFEHPIGPETGPQLAQTVRDEREASDQHPTQKE